MGRKEVIYYMAFIFVALIIFSTLYFRGPTLTGFSVKEFKLEKVDPEIKEKLKNNEKVEVIVSFKKNSDTERFQTEGEESKWAVLKLDKDEFKELSESEEVEAIELQREFEIFLEDSVDITNAEDVWNLQIGQENLTGQSNAVCVIDTGIDFSHPSLQGKDALGCNVYCYDSPCVVTCDETDLNGHGTHVAGIIAASGQINGISPGTKLIGVKIFQGNSGTGTKTANIRRGLQWCVNNIDEYNISTITLSLGTSGTYTTYCDANFNSIANVIKDAFDKNVSTTAATGNQGRTNRISSPACISYTIPVAATNKDDTLASYSNIAGIVQLLAPGTDIASTCNGGSGTCVKTGTSMATPMVAAAISIINQHLDLTNRQMTPHEIESLLYDTGKSISPITLPYIFSRIDLLSANLELDNIAPVTKIGYTQASQISGNVTLRCNATDWQISQLSMRVWNSTGIYQETNFSVNGSYGESQINMSNLDSGQYVYNCLASDAKNNAAYALEGIVFNVGGISVTNISPANNSYFNSDIEFLCSAETSSDSYIEQINLNINYGNSSISQTYNGSESFELAEFTQSLTEETSYLWFCTGYNNLNLSSSSPNLTFVYDITPPNIDLNYPEDEAQLNSSPVNVSFNITDSSPTNCALLLNGENRTHTNTNGQSIIALSLESGEYSWQVSCQDNAGNQQISEERFFELEVETGTSGGQPGSGGGSSGSSSGGGGGGGGGATGSTSTDSETIPDQQNPESTPEQNPEDSPNPTITGRPIQETESSGNIWFVIIVILLGMIIISAIVYRSIKKHRQHGLQKLKEAI